MHRCVHGVDSVDFANCESNTVNFHRGSSPRESRNKTQTTLGAAEHQKWWIETTYFLGFRRFEADLWCFQAKLYLATSIKFALLIEIFISVNF